VEYKTKMKPVMTGVTGTNPQLFRKYLSSILGKHKVTFLHQGVILGTDHLLQKFQSINTKLFWEKNITCNIKCNYRIAVTT